MLGFLALVVMALFWIWLFQDETGRHRRMAVDRTAVEAGLAAWVDEHGGTVVDVADRLERARLRSELGTAGGHAVAAARADVGGRAVTLLSWRVDSEDGPSSGTVAAVVLSTSTPPVEVRPRLFLRKHRSGFDRAYVVKQGGELLGAPERSRLVRLGHPDQVGGLVSLRVAEGTLTLRIVGEVGTAGALRAVADAAVALAAAVDTAVTS